MDAVKGSRASGGFRAQRYVVESTHSRSSCISLKLIAVARSSACPFALSHVDHFVTDAMPVRSLDRLLAFVANVAVGSLVA